MSVKIIECPRDAMQGITNFIDTADKIDYINQLLKVGFDTIDFGSSRPSRLQTSSTQGPAALTTTFPLMDISSPVSLQVARTPQILE